MTPDQQIENFAKGWVAQAVRHEPVAKLKGRLKVSISLTLVFFALFVSSLVFGFGSWTKWGFVRLDMLLAILTGVMGVAALQMWRFINLRISLSADQGAVS